MLLKPFIRRICLLLVLCLSGLVFSCASPDQPSVSVPETAQPDSAMPEPSEEPSEPDASSLSDDADLSSEPESTPVMKTETARCKCETKEEYKEYLVSLLNEKGYHGVQVDAETGERTHVVRTDYNTAYIGSVSDCTSPDVESRSDIRLYMTDTAHYFLDIGGELYRYDPFGGYHYAMALCDVDGNGTDDLVFYHSSGSGIPYIGLSVFNLTAMEGSIVKNANLLQEPSFAFHYDGEHVYAGNRRLDWKDGQYVFTDVGPIEDDAQFPYSPEFLIPDGSGDA